MKKPFAAFIAVFALAAAACAAAPPRRGGELFPARGSTMDYSWHDAPKTVKDTQIMSFKVAFRQKGKYMLQKDGRWEPY